MKHATWTLTMQYESVEDYNAGLVLLSEEASVKGADLRTDAQALTVTIVYPTQSGDGCC